MSENGQSPSERFHSEIAALIATGARKASDISWEEVEQFIGPVARYFDGLIEQGATAVSEGWIQGPSGGPFQLCLIDEGGDVWHSKPAPLFDAEGDEE